MIKSFAKFGYAIYEKVPNEWYYMDTDERADLDLPCIYPCKLCGKNELKDCIDPCLGMLDNVQGACCGHGVSKGYIWYSNGKRIVAETKKLLIRLKMATVYEIQIEVVSAFQAYPKQEMEKIVKDFLQQYKDPKSGLGFENITINAKIKA